MALGIPLELVVAALSIFLFAALCAALALVVISLRRPATLPLAAATGLVILALMVVIVSPVKVPAIVGVILGVLGTALAALGGNPFVRRVLQVATHDRTRETDDGGIVVLEDDDEGDAERTVLLRGGRTIGYLERISAAIGIIAGFPEALAVIVAVKGVGRFSELAAPEARERFIIGTFASLLWACVVGALVRLAVW